VQGGIEAETRQVMENIQALLRERGLRMRHVVKCTVFLRDIRDRDAMSAIYVSYFPEQLPARSAVGVTGLSQGAAVEIECLAARGRQPPEP
jgi:reactive intermediate/imine deaminase